MIEGWSVIALALGYVSSLFALAWYADRTFRSRKGGDGRPLIYALSLAVYCTSWTFFGSVGLAASSGYNFFPSISARSCSSRSAGAFWCASCGSPRARTSPRSPTSSPPATARARPLAPSSPSSRWPARCPTSPCSSKPSLSPSSTLLGALPLQLFGMHDRYGARDRAADGHVRRAVRHAPHRRDRAPGRPDRRGRGRVARQARRLPDGRLLRHFSPCSAASAAFSRRLPTTRRSSGCSPRASTAAPGSRSPSSAWCASCCCRGSSTSRWWRTIPRTRSGAPRGCSRSTSC